MDSKSYALLAQWLNGMSLAVNSYLIPIQLCGERKRNAIDAIISMAFLSFSLVIMRIHVTAIIESVRFFVIL